MIPDCEYTILQESTKWRQVFASVCKEIRSGKYKSGSPFYTVMGLCHAYGISNITARRVFQELKSKNLIITDGRRGTMVVSEAEKKRKVFLCLQEELIDADRRVSLASRIYHEIMMGLQSEIPDDPEIVPISLDFLFAHAERFRDQDLLVGAESLLDVSDGIVNVNQELIHRLKSMFNPIVIRGVDGFEGISQVSVDYRTGFASIVSYLFQHGYRKIGFICGKTNSPWFYPRFLGYMDAIHSQGLELNPELLKITSGNSEEDIVATQELLHGKEKPDAIVCANDGRALNVLGHLEKEGIHVPGKLAVTGFDNIHEAELCQPKLTTMDPGIRKIAREVLILLRQRQSGTIREPVIRKVEPKLVIRESA